MRYVGPRHYVIDDEPAPVPFWSPDDSFAGQTVTVIGGGPSLADLDLDELTGHPFIAVNSGCRKVHPIARPTDPLYFSDNSWSASHPELLTTWPGPVVTSNRNTKARLGDAVKRLDLADMITRLGAFGDDVYTSSGHAAACLAAVMGAKKILLLGFEAQAVNGRTHGHEDYHQHDMAAFKDRYLPAWRGLVSVFTRNGVAVLNVTPGSAIKDFPFATLKEGLS